MVRVRSAVAALAVSAVALSACQTTGTDQPSGTTVGAVSGAAVGAGSQTGMWIGSGGNAGNPLLGLLVGAIVGGIAGHYATGASSGSSVTREDMAAADDAVRTVANDPDGKKVYWGDKDEITVFGWAEVLHNRRNEGGEGCKTLKSTFHVNGLENYEIRYFCPKDGRWVERSTEASTS